MARKKQTPEEPKQNRLCFIVKWTNEDPRMAEMFAILSELCTGLKDNKLADDIYLTLNNASMFGYNYKKDSESENDDTRME
jgi:hypothetical protein